MGVLEAALARESMGLRRDCIGIAMGLRWEKRRHLLDVPLNAVALRPTCP